MHSNRWLRISEVCILVLVVDILTLTYIMDASSEALNLSRHFCRLFALSDAVQ